MRTVEGSVWLHRFAVLTTGATFLLIIAGALVVGNEAGLAVPDWPLSYGSLMPPMEGNIFYEHGHRMVATFVGFLMTVLAIWLWRKEPRSWVRKLGLGALLLVIAQGILGGITVLYLLPTPVAIGHACMAQGFFCLTLSLAAFTSPGWNSPSEPFENIQAPALRHLATATTAAIFLQLVLGAALRHKAVGLLPHLLWAGVVSGLVGWLVFRAVARLPAQKPLPNLSLAAGVLLVLQLALGFGSYLARAASNSPDSHVHGAHLGAVQPEPFLVWITTAHVAVGALLLGTAMLLTLLEYRSPTLLRKAPAFAGSPQKSLA